MTVSDRPLSGRRPEEPPSPGGASVAATAIAGVVFTVLSLPVGDARTTISVAAGAAAAVLNLFALGVLVRKLVPARDEDGQAPASSPLWVLLAFAKLAALFGGALLAMHLGWVRPVPLVAGYLALPVGLVAAALRRPGDEGDRRA